MESWIVLFGLLPTLVGIPVGIPPGPEDPVMSSVAPEKCIFYATWAPRAQADGSSKNQTEQLIAEPEIQRIVKKLDAEVNRALGRIALRERDRAAALYAQLAPKLLKTVLTETGAIYVESFELVPPGPPTVRGAAILRLGKVEQELAGLIRTFGSSIPDAKVQSVRISDTEFQRVQIEETPTLTWGIRKGYLIVGIGDNAVESLIERSTGKAPKWLEEVRARMELPRRATLAYVDVRPIAENARKFGGPQVDAALKASGLAGVEGLITASGLDETGYVSKTLLKLNGKPEGLLSGWNGKGIAADELKAIPADAFAAVAFRLDLGQTLADGRKVIEQVQPEAALQLDQGLEEANRFLQADVQEQILPSIGDLWYVYASPSTGGLLSGWTAVVSVKDRNRLQRTHDMLLGMLRAQRGPNVPQVRATRFGDYDINYVHTEEQIPVAPAWCLTDREFVIGLFPQAVVAHLSAAKSTDAAVRKSLVDHPAVREALGGENGPLMISYVDVKPIFDLLYPLMQVGAQTGLAELRKEGIDLDVTILPSAPTISRHLGPAIATTRLTDNGLEIVQRQSVPGGNLGASAPVAVAMLLPATIQARGAAQRMQSSNNLKQIALAMHNFHDTYGSLPAAYNTDDKGRPLLSWRVYLLPFLEQAPLFNEFHLDEPWDSEHNKKLIERIPPTYQAPGSKAEAGKTNYIGPRSAYTILSPPKDSELGKKMPAGTRFADVTDGTSNTVMVVEASDEKAVIWTKPDDFEFDPKNPIAGLVGLRPEGFLAAMADGSVRLISAMVDPVVVNNIFTRNGGEIVNLP